MTALHIFDPLAGPPNGWPSGREMERAYLEAFASAGSTALISNLRTQVQGLQSGDRMFPLTINEAEYGDSYVCLPHTAYALYAKEELRLVDAGRWTPALGLLASSAGQLLRAAGVNRIVNVDNWMLSTNLHGDWRGDDVSAIRDVLAAAYPKHVIAVRSLNSWSDATLVQHFRSDGWKLLPSRQIYVTEDLEKDWLQRRDTKRDLALMCATTQKIDLLHELRAGDAKRIADLYAMLYLDRYSRLNPVFTEAFIEMTHREGVFRYRGMRDTNGVLSAVVGCFVRGNILTTPIVGYDTARPPKEGLYRMASVLLAQMAQESGLRLNGSAGAASFKRNRGAQPEIEYTAFYVDHLSPFRRSVVSTIEAILNRIAVPLMAERGL
jgi:hypothetical protein